MNNVPYSKFAYLTDISSDVQGQFNTANTKITELQAKTTDMSYNSTTLTTRYSQNLIVDGCMNNVPYSKFAYLTDISSNVQGQLTQISNILSQLAIEIASFKEGMYLGGASSNLSIKIENLKEGMYLGPISSQLSSQLTIEIDSCKEGMYLGPV